MDPIQALNVLSQVVKGAKYPFNEHVLLERCVDIVAREIQSKTKSDSNGEVAAQGSAGPVTFEEPEPVEDVVMEAPEKKPRARARAKRK